MITTPYSRTDLSKKDRFHRLINRIEGRLLFFTEQVDYRTSSPLYDMYAHYLKDFENTATKHICRLKGVSNNFNYNKTEDTNGILQQGGDTFSEETRLQRNEDKVFSRADRAMQAANRKERIYKEAYEWVKEWPDRVEHIRNVLKIDMPEDYYESTDLDWVIEGMSKNAWLSAVSMLKSRLHLMFKQALDDNWFITFTTLTVDNVHKDEVFKVGSNVWRNYYDKIKRMVQTKAYGSVRQARKNDPCFHYLSVVEEGSNTGQLHIHALFFMKVLPDCLDPNYGLRVPYKREISEFEYLWEYGYSQTIAVRFSQSDAYGQLGWCWPVNNKQQPIPESTVVKLTQYMTKYILKSKLNTKGLVPWRTRTDALMGKTKLNRAMEILQDKEVFSLVALNVYPRKIKLWGQDINTKIIREAALSEQLRRDKEQKKKLEALERDTRLKTLLRSGTIKKHGRRSQNTGNILAEIYVGRNTSNEAILEQFKQAALRLEMIMPGEEGFSVSGGIINGTN